MTTLFAHINGLIWTSPLLIVLIQDQLLFCDDCDRGYHMYCLTPPMSDPPEGKSLYTACKTFMLKASSHFKVIQGVSQNSGSIANYYLKTHISTNAQIHGLALTLYRTYLYAKLNFLLLASKSFWTLRKKLYYIRKNWLGLEFWDTLYVSVNFALCVFFVCFLKEKKTNICVIGPHILFYFFQK